MGLPDDRRCKKEQHPNDSAIAQAILAACEQETTKPHRVSRKQAALDKRYAQIERLATRQRGVNRAQLQRLKGFRRTSPTMANLRPAANRLGYRIVATGPHGDTDYRFEPAVR
jgi:hypothetical protein